MTDLAALEQGAPGYVDLGWPVLPIRAGTKEPLTANGVHDATVDPATIRRWLTRWPDAGIAVATGAPGPHIVDVDNPERAGDTLPRLRRCGAPMAATARGLHFYFAGTYAGTVVLGYGELRGRGSYTILPPSWHPDGKQYTWLDAPHGRRLPVVPDWLVPDGVTTAGAGEHQAPTGLVAHGQRHPYLTDFAVRLVRAGVTDQARMLAHLRCEFEIACEPLPAPKRGYFEDLANWAVHTRIAERERAIATTPPTTPLTGSWWARSPLEEADNGR